VLCAPTLSNCTFVRRVALVLLYHSQFYYLLFVFLMSLPHPTSSSSNFQVIFDNALKAYKKRARNDLLTHPLANRFEACDSASSFLAVLQEQVQQLNNSQGTNAKWLDPTVNVLYTFSEMLGEGVGSVRIRAELVQDLLSFV
jgi:hypothetical protein